jgi:hypothetical protein
MPTLLHNQRVTPRGYFAAFFTALVAAAFFGAARCAFVFVVRAVTLIFSSRGSTPNHFIVSCRAARL